MVAGAGPAGARVAQLLSRRGISVVLVERLKRPQDQIFSSAVIPIRALHELRVPISAVSTFWSGWQLFDPNGISHEWFSDENIGVVLDFAEFRKQLWAKASESGVELLLGWRVSSVQSHINSVEVLLVDPNGSKQIMMVDWVIDATGNRRALLGKPELRQLSSNDHLMEGSGIEWILQGDEMNTFSWMNRVTFFLGTKWIPYGYGWIFPMAYNRLKIGVCRLPPAKEKRLVPLLDQLLNLINENGLNNLSVIDRHGGTIRSTLRRSEPHLSERIFGVGDVISTANLLGGEGIRHALASAEVLADFISKLCLSKHSSEISSKAIDSTYKSLLRRRLGFRWNISNKIAKRTWLSLSNEKADMKMTALINGMSKNSSAEDLSALLFDYRFERYGFRLMPYLFGWR